MISRKLIEELAGKYQTIEINIAREYCQHLFLSNLYQMKKSERILFKGGTALRVMYQSPRFSEDLDFSCSGVKIKDIEDLLLRNVIEIEKSEIGVEILESKSTSGGYLGKLYFRFFDFEETIRIEGSFRHKIKIKPEVFLINSDYVTPYTVLCLPPKQLVDEKIEALLRRGKPRDYYDIYFLLRSDLPIDKKNLKLGSVLHKLNTTPIDFKRELKKLLPKRHHAILRDFGKVLGNEIKRYGY